MKNKNSHYKKPLKKWTIKQIKNELKGLEQMIKIAGYGTKDLIFRDYLEQELEKRINN